MKVTQEPEGLNRRALDLGVLGFVVSIVIGAAAAWWLLRPHASRAAEAGATRSKSYQRMSEVNRMETSLFRSEPTERPTTRHGREQLASYGWTDRERGIVHIPIERAIELYLASPPRPAPPDAGVEAAPPAEDGGAR